MTLSLWENTEKPRPGWRQCWLHTGAAFKNPQSSDEENKVASNCQSQKNKPLTFEKPRRMLPLALYSSINLFSQNSRKEALRWSHPVSSMHRRNWNQKEVSDSEKASKGSLVKLPCTRWRVNGLWIRQLRTWLKNQRGKEKTSRDFSISVASGFQEKDPGQKALNWLLCLE